LKKAYYFITALPKNQEFFLHFLRLYITDKIDKQKNACYYRSIIVSQKTTEPQENTGT